MKPSLGALDLHGFRNFTFRARADVPASLNDRNWRRPAGTLPRARKHEAREAMKPSLRVLGLHGFKNFTFRARSDAPASLTAMVAAQPEDDVEDPIHAKHDFDSPGRHG
jgi:hypothetical protein